MKIQKYNVSKPTQYTDKQGQLKTKWDNIGTMTEFHKDDGSIGRQLEIPAIGLEAQIFPWVDKNEQQAEQQYQNYGQPTQTAPQQPQNTQVINSNDIPF